MDKILVILEREADSQVILTKAAQLAKRLGAKLELFSCCFNQSLVASYPFDAESRAHAKLGFVHGCEKFLDELAQPLLEAGLEVATDVSWDASKEHCLLQKIERFEPDLVIKACGLHRHLGIPLFGHLDWQLIRQCPAPLMLTKEHPWRPAMKVVACIDPMHAHDQPASLDRSIIEVARGLIDAMQGELRLFHSFQALPVSVIFDDTMVLDFDQFRQQLRLKHLHALDDLLQPFGLSSEDVCIREGEAYQELPDFAEQESADLVVMGAVSRGSLDRLFIGSTAEKTLDHLQSDLLIVRAGTLKAVSA